MSSARHIPHFFFSSVFLAPKRAKHIIKQECIMSKVIMARVHQAIKIKRLARLRFPVRMWTKTRFLVVNVRLAKLNYSFTEHRNPLGNEKIVQVLESSLHIQWNSKRSFYFQIDTNDVCVWDLTSLIWKGERTRKNTLYSRKWHSNRKKWDIFANVRKSKTRNKLWSRPAAQAGISRCHIGWRPLLRFVIWRFPCLLNVSFHTFDTTSTAYGWCQYIALFYEFTAFSNNSDDFYTMATPPKTKVFNACEPVCSTIPNLSAYYFITKTINEQMSGVVRMMK